MLSFKTSIEFTREPLSKISNFVTVSTFRMTISFFSVKYFKILNLECITDLGGPLLLEKLWYEVRAVFGAVV